MDRVWYGTGTLARLARTALVPPSLLFRAVTAARNALYDRGMLAQRVLALPAISVGNLTVGGTGKTPVAGWIAHELARRGVRAAIVLRGYGDDEPEVHRRLNPGVIVIADPDRVAGVARAAAAGAAVAVLDDAFQHRRARRDADIVLVSADRWPSRIMPLPAGPFREGLPALRRASLVIVTRKAADARVASGVVQAVRRAAPDRPVMQLFLSPDTLVDLQGRTRPLAALRGRHVMAICGIGDPDAFKAQLEGAGAAVVLHAFPDHHAYRGPEVDALAAEAARTSAAGGLVVCTLKDAVKLGPCWPSEKSGLSFLSQQVIVESGHEALDRLLDSVLHARTPAAVAAD